MDYFDFEGHNEQEAIEIASTQLGLEPEEFEIELLDLPSKNLFRRNKVKIRVFPLKSTERELEPENIAQSTSENLEHEQQIFEKTKDFLDKCTTLMGIPCETKLTRAEKKQLEVQLISEHTAALIGHHGKHLEALQIVINAYLANEQSHQENFSYVRVILDAEKYRLRRYKQLQRMAREIAKKVISKKSSELLEPMNAFERRLIHTTLGNYEQVYTVSEGNGENRQVRVLYRESPDQAAH